MAMFWGFFPMIAISDVAIKLEGTKLLRIYDGALTKPAIEQIQDIFRRHPQIEVIELENIPGGLGLAKSRLYGSFYARRVIVKGFCMSACALLALSSRQVSMQRDAMLLFHGSFDIRTGQWMPHSMEHFNWLASKLPTVDPAAIETALSSRDSENTGLVIMAPRSGTLVRVELCNPLPDNCRTVRYMGPGESPISIAR